MVNISFFKLSPEEQKIFDEKFNALKVFDKYDRFRYDDLSIFTFKELYQDELNELNLLKNVKNRPDTIAERFCRVYNFTEKVLEPENLSDDKRLEFAKQFIVDLKEIEHPTITRGLVLKELLDFLPENYRDAFAVIFVDYLNISEADLRSSDKFERIFNHIISETEYAEEFIEVLIRNKIKPNASLVIFNKHVEPEKKLKIIKKYFILKDVNKFSGYFLTEMTDLRDLDIFIEATILQNKRITKKSAAIGQLCYNIFGQNIKLRYSKYEDFCAAKYKNVQYFSEKYSKLIDFAEFGNTFPDSLSYTEDSLSLWRHDSYLNSFCNFMEMLMSPLDDVQKFSIVMKYPRLLALSFSKKYHGKYKELWEKLKQTNNEFLMEKYLRCMGKGSYRIDYESTLKELGDPQLVLDVYLNLRNCNYVKKSFFSNSVLLEANYFSCKTYWCGSLKEKIETSYSNVICDLKMLLTYTKDGAEVSETSFNNVFKLFSPLSFDSSQRKYEIETLLSGGMIASLFLLNTAYKKKDLNEEEIITILTHALDPELNSIIYQNIPIIKKGFTSSIETEFKNGLVLCYDIIESDATTFMEAELESLEKYKTLLESFGDRYKEKTQPLIESIDDLKVQIDFLYQIS